MKSDKRHEAEDVGKCVTQGWLEYDGYEQIPGERMGIILQHQLGGGVRQPLPAMEAVIEYVAQIFLCGEGIAVEVAERYYQSYFGIEEIEFFDESIGTEEASFVEASGINAEDEAMMVLAENARGAICC